MKQRLRPATHEDLSVIFDFIGQANLNKDGIEENVDNFLLMENVDGKVSAIVGMEKVAQDGLIRSLVFSKDTKQGQLFTFFQGMIAYAEEKGLDKLFLLTDKDAMTQFFHVFGFSVIEEIPEHIKQSQHFQETRKRVEPIAMMCDI